MAYGCTLAGSIKCKNIVATPQCRSTYRDIGFLLRRVESIVVNYGRPRLARIIDHEQVTGKRRIFIWDRNDLKGCAEQLCGSHKCFARSVRKSDYFRIVRWITPPKELSRTIIIGGSKEGFSRADVMALPQGSLCNIRHAIRRRTPGFEPSVFISVRDQACSSKHFAEVRSSIGGESRGPKGFKRERFVSEQEFHRATSFLQGFELPPREVPNIKAWPQNTLSVRRHQVNANQICIRILTL